MCQIKIGATVYKKFKTSKGLILCCPLSSIFFKVYMDVCLREWIKKCNKMGIELKEGKFLLHLLFADDQVVITQDGEDANYVCNKPYKEYRKYSYK